MRPELNKPGAYRDHVTQPPNGSFWGIPSHRTRVRAAALAPTPRRLTPAEVGLPKRADCLRYNENEGSPESIWSMVRGASSAMSSADQEAEASSPASILSAVTLVSGRSRTSGRANALAPSKMTNPDATNPARSSERTAHALVLTLKFIRPNTMARQL